jgi:hypothetical protein
VANGLRSRYLNAIEAGDTSVKLSEIGTAAFTDLVELEPYIVEDLKELGAGAAGAPADIGPSTGFVIAYGLET